MMYTWKYVLEIELNTSDFFCTHNKNSWRLAGQGSFKNTFRAKLPQQKWELKRSSYYHFQKRNKSDRSQNIVWGNIRTPRTLLQKLCLQTKPSLMWSKIHFSILKLNFLEKKLWSEERIVYNQFEVFLYPFVWHSWIRVTEIYERNVNWGVNNL